MQANRLQSIAGDPLGLSREHGPWSLTDRRAPGLRQRVTKRYTHGTVSVSALSQRSAVAKLAAGTCLRCLSTRFRFTAAMSRNLLQGPCRCFRSGAFLRPTRPPSDALGAKGRHAGGNLGGKRMADAPHTLACDASPALSRRHVLALLALGSAATAPDIAAAAKEGQLTWGVHVSLAPTWFDPAEISGIITAFMVLYALHDAMVKPMPGQASAPSLAETWTASADGLTYDFVLRQGASFHNGDPVTADDVKYLIRALSWRCARPAKGPRRCDRGARSPPYPLQAQAAVARLSYLLCERIGGRVDRPAQIRREGRRRRLQEGPNWRWTLQVCLLHARRGAGLGGLRPVLAQTAKREAPRLQGHSRRDARAWQP